MFQPVLATPLILPNGFGRYGGRFRNSGHVNLPRMFLINAQELKNKVEQNIYNLQTGVSRSGPLLFCGVQL